MSRRVRIALVGLGRMGRIHATSLASRCPGAELAAVFDAAPGLARQVAEQLGVPAAPSYEAILADDTIEAVAIATPTDTHAALSRQAGRAGKHVFSEKPISLDRDTTVATVEALAADGVRFQVGFHRRFDPDWTAAMARIDAGELGQPYLFRTSLRDMRPPRAEFLAGSGGFFVDVTIHDLDTARWMVGEVAEVSAYGAALATPEIGAAGDVDTALVTLRFTNGALGVIDNSRAAGYGYECSTEIVGSLATVRIDRPHHRNVEWRTPGWSTHPLHRDFEQRYPEAYTYELDAFARCVRDNLEPAVTGWDALAAFDLARAAELSRREQRRVAVAARRPEQGGGYAIDPETP